jgi:choline dehydrogenase
VSHNALVWINPHASDWDNIASITGDKTWAATNMIQYLNKSQEWITTEMADPTRFQNDVQYAQQIDAGAAAMGRAPSRASPLSGFANLFQNPNTLAPGRDSQQGYFGVPLITQKGARHAVRERIVDTVNAGFPLTVRLNAFVTKVVFTNTSGTPRATGVQFLDGAHLYRASPLSGGKGTPGSATATKEVILAGGVYNTVQLLKLSGIGPSAELKSFGIAPLVNLPGVGTNMQDRYEVGVNVLHQKEFSILKGCTYTTGADDACYQQWVNNPSNAGTSRGTYVSDGIASAMGVRSAYAQNTDLDLFLFAGAFNFNGYFPGWPASALPDHLHFSWYMLKGHTRNTAGTVKLRSADPLDPPVINFNYFDTGTTAGGADTSDLGALVQGVRLARSALAGYANYSSLGGSPFTELSPGPNVTSDADLGQWVKDRAWGHHASCTNKIGAAGDANAVLDSKFRVRGTLGLRVVDASVFPRIPGFFIQAPIIMMSEKAADSILSGN